MLRRTKRQQATQTNAKTQLSQICGKTQSKSLKNIVEQDRTIKEIRARKTRKNISVQVNRNII